MTSIITLRKIANYRRSHSKNAILSNFNVINMSCEKTVSTIRDLVLLDLLNSLRKSNKMLDKPRILSLFLNLFNKFNKT